MKNTKKCNPNRQQIGEDAKKELPRFARKSGKGGFHERSTVTI
ncbi:hypothetical protein AALC75_01805 [Lachnospiraceae bacterium 48-42]